MKQNSLFDSAVVFRRISGSLSDLAEHEPWTTVAGRNRRFAWQHLEMCLPRTWNPVRVEGEFDTGRVEWADPRGPTLGLRWSTPQLRRLQPDVAARQALQREVGMLAAEEAKTDVAPPGDWVGSLLFEEATPPGRDVYSAYSSATGRLVQLVYFSKRRETVLRDRILPTLIDHPVGRATPWAIFDLNLVAPAEATLVGQRFNAGDLAMRFSGPVGAWTVRQLAPASLALSRQTLGEWAAAAPPTIGSSDRALPKHYRLVRADPRAEAAAHAVWQRKRRYFWRPSLSRTRVTLASVDAVRDRVILMSGADPALLGEIRDSVGSLTPISSRNPVR